MFTLSKSKWDFSYLIIFLRWILYDLLNIEQWIHNIYGECSDTHLWLGGLTVFTAQSCFSSHRSLMTMDTDQPQCKRLPGQRNCPVLGQKSLNFTKELGVDRGDSRQYCYILFYSPWSKGAAIAQWYMFQSLQRWRLKIHFVETVWFGIRGPAQKCIHGVLL